MSHSEETSKRWQISLRTFLGLFVLLGVELWLVRQGFAWTVLAPLFVAISLQLAGREQAAYYAALVTAVWWLAFPCIMGITQADKL